MIGCVDDEEIGDFEFEFVILVDDGSFLVNGIGREVCSINLLCDIVSFVFLDVGLMDFVE